MSTAVLRGAEADAAPGSAGFAPRNPLRHQLPVHSPISLRALLAAAGEARGASDPRVALRNLLREEFAAEEVVLCGSGTQALQLALQALAVPAAPIALPAFSCFDVASAAVAAGRPVLLYDLDPDTLGPDLPSLERALRQGARTAVIAPLYGIPVAWRELEKLAETHGAALLEDAAQGQGASWRARPLGSLGRASVLSFGRGKGWTGGSGGALLFRDRDDAAGIAALPEPTGRRELRQLGGALAQRVLGRPAVYGLPAALPWLGLGETRYKDAVPPRSMGRGAAALALRSREAAAREARRRRENAAAFLTELPSLRIPRPPADAESSYLRLPIRLARGLAGFADPAAARRLGIAASYPSTLRVLPKLAPLLAASAERFPGAETLVGELVTLPTHTLVRPAERAQIIGLLEGYHHGR